MLWDSDNRLVLCNSKYQQFHSLPASVVLRVTDAPEGIRGDSANNVQKPVKLETGISIQVPLFIKTGEKVKIDTRTGKYMERA